MAVKVTDRVLEVVPGLDGLAETVQHTLSPMLGPEGPKTLQDMLNGTWFGHPLHPAVATLPLGAWTSALLLDLAGMKESADLNLGIGVLGALGAAATGAAQWQDTQGKPRRLGLLHALLNTGATTLAALSLLQRARGSRSTGVALSATGWAIGLCSAWLGGDLAYDLGIGVRHTAFEEPPVDWTDVLDEGELPENTLKRVVANGVPVVLWRSGDDLAAISATCTHLGGPLDEGTLEGDTVQCPWHGSVFCLRDGSVIHGPATMPEPAFEVRAQNGKIAVRRSP